VSDRRIKLLLFQTILVVCALPMATAFYLVDDALQRSLNLGFNPEVVRSLNVSIPSSPLHETRGGAGVVVGV